ncbi:MAG: twin-arginine translocation signal domain-containing protein, partial [Planctomycetota bacterium]
MSAGPKSTTPDGNDDNFPAWRQHFPVETDKESARARREFLGGLTVAGAAMACGQVALKTVSPGTESVSAEDASETQQHE